MNEALAPDQNAQEIRQAKEKFKRFLDPQDGEESLYVHKVEEMLAKGKNRLVVDITHLKKADKSLSDLLLHKPVTAIPAFEAALKEHIESSQHGQKAQQNVEWKVGIEGAFGSAQVSPRELLAHHMGRTVCVEGIVTKASLVRPKVVETVHYCETTKKFKSMQYRDATSFRGLPTGAAYPKADVDGNRLETEYGLCTYRDNQKVFIQDMPERTKAGTMPRTIECVLDGSLVDACKPGDRVQMIGVYRSLAGKASGELSGKFKPVVLVNNIRKLGIDEKVHATSSDDLRNIKEVAKRKDCFALLARSVAPSIYGHEFIKKAVVMQLLGGVEKNLDNGTHIRGDINILMVGDPSCAKSQLLRCVMKIAPLAINTTGRGSSGVGLTAAVLQDKDTGERRLEAGAMVLADRGIVCIDEFDKMTDNDRTAIHEVMEQQTVTIAKAGIHTTLNARCSVIAASNPVYGQYDRDKKPHENIALPDSLLSRFDMLFIVLDKLDAKLDRAISAHVLDMHQFREKQEADAYDADDVMEEEAAFTQVYERKEKMLKGAAGAMRRSEMKAGGELEDYLTVDFCKKFIHYAKKMKSPKLTNAAAEDIAQTYAQLRDCAETQSLPITARCLETIIRLSAAHAKCRLSNNICKVDVREASNVLRFALTNDVEGAQDNAIYGEEPDAEDMEMDSQDEPEAAEPKKQPVRSRRRKKQAAGEEEEDAGPSKKARPSAKAPPAGSQQNRQGQLTTFLNKHFRTARGPGGQRVDSVKQEDLFKLLSNSDASWSQEEVNTIVQALHSANKVFVHQGEIHQL